MSVWYEPQTEDVYMYEGDDDITIYLYSDENGAVYASVKISDIKNAMKNPKKMTGFIPPSEVKNFRNQYN